MGLIELRERFESWAKEENLSLKKGRLDYEFEETYTAWRAWRAALAAAPTPPAQEDEPVLYQVWHPNFPVWASCKKVTADKLSEKDGYKIRPLYTHPEDNKLRKAAEEVILWLDGDYMLSASHVLAKNLRAALEGK